MITTFLPVVSNNLPPIIGSFHLWMPLFTISLISFYPSVFFQKRIFYTIILAISFLFIFPYIFWPALTEWNFSSLKFEFYYIVAAILVLVYFISAKDYEGLSFVTKTTLIFIVITSILSIYSSIVDPMYARSITGGKLSEEQLLYFEKIGGGGYGFATALVGLIPVIVFKIKSKKDKINKWILYLVIILIFITLIRMQFFANILISLFVIVFSFSGQSRSKVSIIISLVIILIALAVPAESYAQLLRSLSHYFNTSSEVHYKLNDMADFLIIGDISEDETESGYRAYRYITLYQGFIDSPVFGIAHDPKIFYDDSGAHLFWMNKLSVLGIFGFLFIVVAIFSNLKSQYRFFKEDRIRFFYILSIFGILGLGIMKNIAGREPWFMIFFVIPGLLFEHTLTFKTLGEKY